jgi:leader peptidase (prepilin peptidase)/N-methyltransferase
MLGGRCSSCAGKISIRYLLIEVFFGIAFTALWFLTGREVPGFLIAAAFFTFLFLASYLDIHTGLVYNKITVPGILTGFLASVVPGGIGILQSLTGFLILGGILYVIAVVSRGGMGGGDIKLSALIGAFLGLRAGLVALFTGFLFGAIVGVVLLITGKKTRKDAIAFAPFLSLGGITGLFYGGEVVEWYFNLGAFGT